MNRRLKTARPLAQLRAGRTDWYRIRNAADTGDATIHVYDEIGYWGVTAADFIRELSALDADRISLHINSPGGEIFDGIAIMNALRSHRAQVTTYVDSLAASIASVIAMAGDRVVMAPHSQMMIHDGSGMCVGNAADMRDMAELLDRQSDNIASVYAERAGGTAKQWRSRMEAETWFTAQEAVEAGLADEVAKRRMPDEDMPGMDNSWDLSVFRYAGRHAAPAPTATAARSIIDTATPTHHTDTVDNPWDGGAAERNLPSPVPLGAVRAVYGWYDAEQVEDDAVAKTSCKLPHHEVDADGNPGPANLAGVRNALARLPQSDIPEDQRAAVEAHLRAHLEDGAESEPEDHAGLGLADAWDSAVFKDALNEVVNQTAYDPDVFRSILDHEANNRPAPTIAAPAPGQDADHYDATIITRALKEAAR